AESFIGYSLDTGQIRSEQEAGDETKQTEDLDKRGTDHHVGEETTSNLRLAGGCDLRLPHHDTEADARAHRSQTVTNCCDVTFHGFPSVVTPQGEALSVVW